MRLATKEPLTVNSVGIVGLGDQGTPIAQRVLSQGWPLAFYARRPDVRERFSALGARSLSLIELAAASDLLLVVVVDDNQVNEVLLEQGVLNALRPGSIIAIHSTIRPDTCLELGLAAAEREIHVLDAPVSGGRDRSYAGDLTIMVGGVAAALDAARPVFKAFASLIVHMGPLGSGQKAKILNNYFYAAHLATAAKMIELVYALGIDADAAAIALPQSSGASAALAIQAARRFERTRHDKGAAHALGILTQTVGELRAMAARAQVPLDGVDQLVDGALAAEARRTTEDSRQTRVTGLNDKEAV